MQRVLLIDNFDSFTYNLEHYLTSLEVTVDVQRSDKLAHINLADYDAVVVSPGPGLPADYPEMLSFLSNVVGNIPILGICLGMQALAELLGGALANKERVKHGVAEEIKVVNQSVLFQGLPETFNVGLYHSWFVEESRHYSIDAISVSEGTAMAMSRSDLMLFGVQFHPESIMSEFGKEILQAFLNIKKGDPKIA